MYQKVSRSGYVTALLQGIINSKKINIGPKVLWYYSTKLSFIKSRDRLLRNIY